MRSVLFLLVGALSFAACARDKKSPDGLPPAQDWSANAAGNSPPPSMGNMAPQAGEIGNDPHAGMDIDPNELPPPGTALNADGTDPHAGLAMPGAEADNPHAANPHSGNPHEGGGVDVSKMGLPSPDPNRAIDPNKFVRGSITLDPKVKDKVKSSTLFLSVRKADASGAAVGSPLAVDKLTFNGTDVSFDLTDALAMTGGTQLAGDVIVTARIDQDQDALSKQPGDITGSARVSVPAEHVKIVLDTVL